MALFVRELKNDERKELESLAQQSEGDVPEQRLMIVLLSAQGRRVQEVSREVALHPINVRKWIHRFNEDGIDGLRSGKSPGRPPVFSAQQRERIVEIASADPRQLNMNFSQWSLQRLRKYLIQNAIIDQISVETIRQVLRANGIKHRLNRSWRRDAFIRSSRRPAPKLNLRYETSRQYSQRAASIPQV
ncbi:MAG: helix-turn-helix domain containing protein [Caldilineaceae bacterium]|nr:helix-turn-helix domain containing protein [Caldilineaceae bacterium]